MQDWKDALGALRASVPVDETPDMPATADDAPARQSLTVLLDKKGRKGKAAIRPPSDKQTFAHSYAAASTRLSWIR